MLELYRRTGALRWIGSNELVLQVRIDIHGADCGTPDCYGHDMKLVLRVSSASGRCIVQSAHATNTPFDECGGPTLAAWDSSFTVAGPATIDDQRLNGLELRDVRRREAVLLLRDGFYFYEDVGPDATLKPELEYEGAQDCCYGYTSWALRLYE